MSKPNLIGNTEEKILRQMVRKEVERQMNEYIVGQRIKSMYQDGKMVTEERKFFLFKDRIVRVVKVAERITTKVTRQRDNKQHSHRI